MTTLFNRLFKKKEDTKQEPTFVHEGPVLSIMLGELTIGILFFDGNQFGLIYKEDFFKSNLAPFNPEQLGENNLPELNKFYFSKDLWHSFMARIPSKDRQDFLDIMHKFGLSEDENPLVVLSKIGKFSISKPWRLEVLDYKEKV
jgi:hypothetical protein